MFSIKGAPTFVFIFEIIVLELINSLPFISMAVTVFLDFVPRKSADSAPVDSSCAEAGRSKEVAKINDTRAVTNCLRIFYYYILN